MTNVKILKSLLPLLIVPSLLVDCQALITRADENNHNINIISQITASDASDIKELTQAYNEFDTSINTLIKELKEVVEKKRDKNSVDINTPNQNLKLLREANDNLLAKNISKFKNTLNNINPTLDEISRILKPISNGLTDQNITQIQNYLGLPDKDPSVQRNLGKFGKITQTAIQEFLNERNQKLADTIQELEKVSQSDRTINDNNKPANLETENKQLKTEIDTFYWKYNLSVTAAFGAGICMGMLGIFYYQKLRNKGSNEKQSSFANPEVQEPTYAPNPNYQNYTSQTVTPEPESKPQTKINPPPPQNPANTQPATSNGFNTKIIHNASVTELITIYNQNRNSLSKHSTEVSETEESINQRRLGIYQTAILEKVSKGKGSYWIINKQGIDYLVPKGNIKINEYNYKTVESLFNCQGYQPGVSGNFILVKPAQVTSISQQTWEIVDYGVLKF
jgi:hypothetical protein